MKPGNLFSALIALSELLDPDGRPRPHDGDKPSGVPQKGGSFPTGDGAGRGGCYPSGDFPGGRRPGPDWLWPK
jgi:hypothetical protein